MGQKYKIHLICKVLIVNKTSFVGKCGNLHMLMRLEVINQGHEVRVHKPRSKVIWSQMWKWPHLKSLKSYLYQTGFTDFIDIIWKPSYVHVVMVTNKNNGQQVTCKVTWKCKGSLGISMEISTAKGTSYRFYVTNSAENHLMSQFNPIFVISIKAMMHFLRFFSFLEKIKNYYLSGYSQWGQMKMLCDFYEICWQKICRKALFRCIGWFSLT